MRNFTVMFMILILFLSIIFAIFKPPLKNSKIPDSQNEKTYVEKLLTEKKNPVKDNNFEQQTEIESYENLNTIEEQNFYTNKTNSFDNSIQKNTQPELDNNTEHYNVQNNDFIQVKENSFESRYENISKELSEKYNNNPDAEISEEDLKYFLQKIIDNN